MSSTLLYYGQQLWTKAKTFCSTMGPRMACTVSLRFDPDPDVTKMLVRSPQHQVKPNLYGLVSKLSGMMRCLKTLDDATVGNFGHLGRLCNEFSMLLPVRVCLPVTTAAVKNDLNVEARQREFVAQLAIGTGVNCLGRIEVLDLTGHVRVNGGSCAVNFASLCSLLPSARSLRKLIVSVLVPNDFLWLMYAIFHPQSATTQWRALRLDCSLTAGAWASLNEPVSLLWSCPKITITTATGTNPITIGYGTRMAMVKNEAPVLTPVNRKRLYF